MGCHAKWWPISLRAEIVKIVKDEAVIHVAVWHGGPSPGYIFQGVSLRGQRS
jgi:hypothetical protein